MADVAYCMKCREKREFTGTLVTLKNGRTGASGHVSGLWDQADEDHGHGRSESDGLEGP